MDGVQLGHEAATNNSMCERGSKIPQQSGTAQTDRAQLRTGCPGSAATRSSPACPPAAFPRSRKSDCRRPAACTETRCGGLSSALRSAVPDWGSLAVAGLRGRPPTRPVAGLRGALADLLGRPTKLRLHQRLSASRGQRGPHRIPKCFTRRVWASLGFSAHATSVGEFGLQCFTRRVSVGDFRPPALSASPNAWIQTYLFMVLRSENDFRPPASLSLMQCAEQILQILRNRICWEGADWAAPTRPPSPERTRQPCAWAAHSVLAKWRVGGRRPMEGGEGRGAKRRGRAH